MTAEELMKALPGIAYNFHQKDDREWVNTCFRYPNGDLMIIYVVNSRDSVLLTDLGTTMYGLSLEQFVPNEDVIKQLITVHDVRFDAGALQISMGTSHPSQKDTFSAALSLLQAMTAVSSMVCWPKIAEITEIKIETENDD